MGVMDHAGVIAVSPRFANEITRLTHCYTHSCSLALLFSACFLFFLYQYWLLKNFTDFSQCMLSRAVSQDIRPHYFWPCHKSDNQHGILAGARGQRQAIASRQPPLRRSIVKERIPFVQISNASCVTINTRAGFLRQRVQFDR